jgi:hypothetical protein
MVSAEARSAPTQPENLRDGLLKGVERDGGETRREGVGGKTSVCLSGFLQVKRSSPSAVSRAGAVSILVPSGLARGARDFGV